MVWSGDCTQSSTSRARETVLGRQYFPEYRQFRGVAEKNPHRRVPGRAIVEAIAPSCVTCGATGGRRGRNSEALAPELEISTRNIFLPVAPLRPVLQALFKVSFLASREGPKASAGCAPPLRFGPSWPDAIGCLGGWSGVKE